MIVKTLKRHQHYCFDANDMKQMMSAKYGHIPSPNVIDSVFEIRVFSAKRLPHRFNAPECSMRYFRETGDLEITFHLLPEVTTPVRQRNTKDRHGH